MILAPLAGVALVFPILTLALLDNSARIVVSILSISISLDSCEI